jgi:hypothetical protein
MEVLRMTDEQWEAFKRVRIQNYPPHMQVFFEKKREWWKRDPECSKLPFYTGLL